MSMDLHTMAVVEQLAHEVVDLIDKVRRDIEAADEDYRRRMERAGVEVGGPLHRTSLMSGTRSSGELRRRSMDLTRALADLRRS